MAVSSLPRDVVPVTVGASATAVMLTGRLKLVLAARTETSPDVDGLVSAEFIVTIISNAVSLCNAGRMVSVANTLRIAASLPVMS
jgi:hypothetical protein